MSSKQRSVWPRKCAQPLLRQTSSIKIPLSGACRFVPPLFSKGPVLGNKGSSGKKGGFLSCSVLTLPFLLSTLKSTLLHFLPASLLSFLTILDPPHPYFFSLWQNLLTPLHPPLIAPSSTSFSLCLSCLLAQSLNLLEPRDLVCYVNGLNTDAHVLTYCMYTLACTYKPSFHHTRTHTYMHTCTECYIAKLGFAAFGRRSAPSLSPLSLTS